MNLLAFLGIIFALHIFGLIISLFFIKKFDSVEVDGYKINYRRQGHGPQKIVLVHGMFSNLHCWDKIIQLDNDKYEFFAIDLPQMGESMVKGLKAPADKIEDIIVKFCKILNLEKPTLIGCSLGGLVAFLTKIKYSDYFNKCIVVASPFNIGILLLPVDKLTFMTPLLILFINPLTIFYAHFQVARSKFDISHCFVINSKFRRWRHFSSSLIYTRMISRAEKKHIIPTKVEQYQFIWGTADRLIKKGDFKHFIGSNDRLEYEEIPDATHHPMESHPLAFMKVINKVLDQ